MTEPQQPPPLPIDPFRVNVSNVSAIEQHQANKNNEAKPRGRPPTKDRVEEKEIAKAKEEQEKREAAFKAATKLAIEEKEKKKKDVEVHATATKSRLYRKICEYHRTFPEVFKGSKLPSPDSPVPVLQACLDDMRSNMSTNAADQAIYSMIPKIGYAMEYIVHDVGLNPKGWQLRSGNNSLGKVLEDPEVQEQLEPERTEAVIELRDFFQAPWYFRLGLKFAMLADTYSAHQPKPTTPSASPVNPNDVSDL